MSAEQDAVDQIVAWAHGEQLRLQQAALDEISRITAAHGGYDDDPFEGEDG